MITELVAGRTLGETAYALALLPVGLIGFTFSIAVLSIGFSLAIVWVGVLILAIGNVLARETGELVRRASNLLTGSEVAAPGRPARGGWLRASPPSESDNRRVLAVLQHLN